MGKFKQHFEWVRSQACRVARELNQRKWLYLFVLLMTAAYSAVSILRHWHFESGASDVGIFDQVVWHYSRFETPYTTVRNNRLTEHILGDHFHPILILLAPLYWFTRGAETLLAAQGFLFALSIIPIYLFAEKRFRKLLVWFFVISYAIFWGVQRAVEFEFHEIAFAVPLIAFAIYFIDEKKRVGYFVCIGLMLLTKENLALLVAFFGIYLIVLRRFRDGFVSLALGIGWFFAVLKVFIPYFGKHDYDYWNYAQLGPTPSGALKTMLLKPWRVIQVAISPAVKVQTACYIFFPFLLLSFLSPLIILTIPLLAERFLSTNPFYWGREYHYTATISPVVAMAAIDGLSRIAGLIRSERTRSISVILAGSAVLLLNLCLFPFLPLLNIVHRHHWRFSNTEKIGHSIVRMIPPTASVAAQNRIVPHFSQRTQIFLLAPEKTIPDSEYIIACKQLQAEPYVSYAEIEKYLTLQQTKGYTKVFEQGGWVVLYRPHPDLSLLPTPALLTEETSAQAIALDSVTWKRSPFSVRAEHNLSPDGLARVVLFAANLRSKAGEDIPVVTAQAEDAQHKIYPLTVEFVGPHITLDWIKVVAVKLPADLAPGKVWITITAEGAASNKAFIEIKPP